MFQDCASDPADNCSAAVVIGNHCGLCHGFILLWKRYLCELGSYWLSDKELYIHRFFETVSKVLMVYEVWVFECPNSAVTFLGFVFEKDESMEVWVKELLYTAWWLKLPVWRCCTPDYCSYVLFVLLVHRSTNNKDWQYGNVLHICINLIIVLNRWDKSCWNY